MPTIHVGKRNHSPSAKRIVSRIDMKSRDRLDMLEQRLYELEMSLRIGFDTLKAGKPAFVSSEEKRHAVIDKDGAVVDILNLWSQSSAYIPSLKCYTVECSDKVKVGYFYKSKKFYSPNIFNKVLIKLGVIK